MRLINGEYFEQLRAEGGPIVAQFTGKSCAACRQVEPIIKSLAEKYGGQIKFVLLDVEKSPGATNRMLVRSLPSTVFIKDKKVKGMLAGAVEKETLEKAIKGLING